MKLDFSRKIFEKYFKINENSFSGSRVVGYGRTDGETDGETEKQKERQI